MIDVVHHDEHDAQTLHEVNVGNALASHQTKRHMTAYLITAM